MAIISSHLLNHFVVNLILNFINYYEIIFILLD
jgi:hypothetical protein